MVTGDLVDWLPKCELLIPLARELVLIIVTVKHLPTWLPGTEFITQAKEWRPFVETMSVVPFKDVKQQLVRRLSMYA